MCVSLFGCVVSICSSFLYLFVLLAFAFFAFEFLYLVVLWVFGAHVLLNWWRYFLNFLVLFLFAGVFEVAEHWALSATIAYRLLQNYFWCCLFIFGILPPLTFTVWKRAAWTFCKIYLFVFHRKIIQVGNYINARKWCQNVQLKGFCITASIMKNRLLYLISVKIRRTSLVCLLVAPQQPMPGLVMPHH